MERVDTRTGLQGEQEIVVDDKGAESLRDVVRASNRFHVHSDNLPSLVPATSSGTRIRLETDVCGVHVHRARAKGTLRVEKARAHSRLIKRH